MSIITRTHFRIGIYGWYTTEIYYNYTSGVIIDVSPPLDKKKT